MAVGTNTAIVFRRHEEGRQLVQLPIVTHKAVKGHATEIGIGQADVESVVVAARITLLVARIAMVKLGVELRFAAVESLLSLRRSVCDTFSGTTAYG